MAGADKDKFYKKKKDTTFDRLHNESEIKRVNKEKLTKEKEMAELEKADEMANTYKYLKNNKPRTVEEFMEDQKYHEEKKIKRMQEKEVTEPKEVHSFRPVINPTSKKIVELRQINLEQS